MNISAKRWADNAFVAMTASTGDKKIHGLPADLAQAKRGISMRWNENVLLNPARAYPGGVFSVETQSTENVDEGVVVNRVVVRNLLTGKRSNYDSNALEYMRDCPLPTGANALWITEDIETDVLNLFALGWSLPANWIDTLVEYRLLHATYNKPEQRAFEARCRTVHLYGGVEPERHDVCANLALAMFPSIHLENALCRGGIRASVARMMCLCQPAAHVLLDQVDDASTDDRPSGRKVVDHQRPVRPTTAKPKSNPKLHAKKGAKP